MPFHEEHCQESLRKYGKRFDDLHLWMDEPSGVLGRRHRLYRHDPETTPQEARKLFGEFADHACLDHIRLDELGSEEIHSREMDTGFCANWQGDAYSKHCRVCAQEGSPCLELWKRLCFLAIKGLIFTNTMPGAAFGNRYRIESHNKERCYLRMLQGAKSRFALPIEDFLYVTKTGRGGVNETPSKTRQYPFVHLLLEILASEPEGAKLIREVREEIPSKGDIRDWNDGLYPPLEPPEYWVGGTNSSSFGKIKIEDKNEPTSQESKREEVGKCPKCGSSLVWRTAQRTGERYRGCTNYPSCKYNERSYRH